MTNKLSTLDLLKIAVESKKMQPFLSKMAAYGSQTEFDETVPAANGNEEDKQEQLNGKSTPPEEAAAQPVQDPNAMAPEQAPAAMTPETAGAAAAQAFIGPEILQAAASGDPGAAELVARTAGQIAGSVAESITRAAANAQAPVAGAPAVAGQEGGAPMTGAEAVPAAPMTPEETLANEIVPQTTPAAPAAPAAPAQGPQEDQNGSIDQGKAEQTQVVPNAPNGAQPVEGQGQNGEISDEEALKKVIQMAKAGKI